VRPRGELLDGVDRAERVRDEVVRDHLDVPARRDLVERVELQLAESSIGMCANCAPVFLAKNCHGTKLA
jgi:hypothetical protein